MVTRTWSGKLASKKNEQWSHPFPQTEKNHLKTTRGVKEKNFQIRLRRSVRDFDPDGVIHGASLYLWMLTILGKKRHC